ncbi:transketolase family protein [Faecalicoccus sp. LCP19S3_E2]|uniref:transketolase family protein n=1 Tax=Faecalicoccus sp. LCP19S3_E2 TaxID=3438778 RepID=UPI003F905A97
MATATREAYGKALAKLVQEREDIVVLDADLTKSTKTIEAKKACPERHFNMGIAEGNMMGVAAGLAASHKIVYASSFAMFAAGRAFEQIIKAVADIEGPCYVRLGRLGVEDVYDDSYTWEYGKGQVLKKGSKVAIVATGLMVQESLKAIEQLKDIEPTLINISTIKPIDKDLILETAKTHDVIVTIEEHNVIGGLGGAVAETLAPYGLACRQYMMGMQDSFGRSGKPKDLLAHYHLDASSIAQKIKEIMK